MAVRPRCPRPSTERERRVGSLVVAVRIEKTVHWNGKWKRDIGTVGGKRSDRSTLIGFSPLPSLIWLVPLGGIICIIA